MSYRDIYVDDDGRYGTYDMDGDRFRYEPSTDEEPMQIRNASGISPEELSIQDAYSEGARVGALGLPHSLNPFQDNTPEHESWTRGWTAASSQRAARMVA
jgi:ribosome modulation factor